MNKLYLFVSVMFLYISYSEGKHLHIQPMGTYKKTCNVAWKNNYLTGFCQKYNGNLLNYSSLNFAKDCANISTVNNSNGTLTCGLSKNFVLKHNVYFLSPHMDDIPLTFGGLMQNKFFKIINKNIYYSVFFNISNSTANPSSKNTLNQIDRITGLRYREDLNALDELFNNPNLKIRRYSYTSLGLLDAPLAKLPMYGNFSAIKTNTQKQYFINSYTYLFNLFKNASKIGSCSILVPMALPGLKGIHINHFILREAVIKVVHDLGSNFTCDLYFGEDQPYVGENISGAESIIRQLSIRLALKSITYRIDPVAKYKLLLRNYPSQITPKYHNALYKRYNNLGGAERIYLFPKANYSTTHVDPSCNNQYYCNY